MNILYIKEMEAGLHELILDFSEMMMKNIETELLFGQLNDFSPVATHSLSMMKDHDESEEEAEEGEIEGTERKVEENSRSAINWQFSLEDLEATLKQWKWRKDEAKQSAVLASHAVGVALNHLPASLAAQTQLTLMKEDLRVISSLKQKLENNIPLSKLPMTNALFSYVKLVESLAEKQNNIVTTSISSLLRVNLSELYNEDILKVINICTDYRAEILQNMDELLKSLQEERKNRESVEDILHSYNLLNHSSAGGYSDNDNEEDRERLPQNIDPSHYEIVGKYLLMKNLNKKNKKEKEAMAKETMKIPSFTVLEAYDVDDIKAYGDLAVPKSVKLIQLNKTEFPKVEIDHNSHSEEIMKEDAKELDLTRLNDTEQEIEQEEDKAVEEQEDEEMYDDDDDGTEMEDPFHDVESVTFEPRFSDISVPSESAGCHDDEEEATKPLVSNEQMVEEPAVALKSEDSNFQEQEQETYNKEEEKGGEEAKERETLESQTVVTDEIASFHPFADSEKFEVNQALREPDLQEPSTTEGSLQEHQDTQEAENQEWHQLPLPAPADHQNQNPPLLPVQNEDEAINIILAEREEEINRLNGELNNNNNNIANNVANNNNIANNINFNDLQIHNNNNLNPHHNNNNDFQWQLGFKHFLFCIHYVALFLLVTLVVPAFVGAYLASYMPGFAALMQEIRGKLHEVFIQDGNTTLFAKLLGIPEESLDWIYITENEKEVISDIFLKKIVTLVHIVWGYTAIISLIVIGLILYSVKYYMDISSLSSPASVGHVVPKLKKSSFSSLTSALRLKKGKNKKNKKMNHLNRELSQSELGEEGEEDDEEEEQEHELHTKSSKLKLLFLNGFLKFQEIMNIYLKSSLLCFLYMIFQPSLLTLIFLKLFHIPLEDLRYYLEKNEFSLVIVLLMVFYFISLVLMGHIYFVAGELRTLLKPNILRDFLPKENYFEKLFLLLNDHNQALNMNVNQRNAPPPPPPPPAVAAAAVVVGAIGDPAAAALPQVVPPNDNNINNINMNIINNPNNNNLNLPLPPLAVPALGVGIGLHHHLPPPQPLPPTLLQRFYLFIEKISYIELVKTFLIHCVILLIGMIVSMILPLKIGHYLSMTFQPLVFKIVGVSSTSGSSSASAAVASSTSSSASAAAAAASSGSSSMHFPVEMLISHILLPYIIEKLQYTKTIRNILKKLFTNLRTVLEITDFLALTAFPELENEINPPPQPTENQNNNVNNNNNDINEANPGAPLQPPVPPPQQQHNRLPHELKLFLLIACLLLAFTILTSWVIHIPLFVGRYLLNTVYHFQSDDLFNYPIGFIICYIVVYTCQYILLDLLQIGHLLHHHHPVGPELPENERPPSMVWMFLLIVWKWVSLGVKIFVAGFLWLLIPPLLIGYILENLFIVPFRTETYTTPIFPFIQSWILGLIALKLFVK
jgi:hypothetical protein